MNSIQSLFQQTNPYEKFVTQLVQIESRDKLLLEAQRSAQSEKKSALGEVSASISKFISSIEELEDPNNKSFHPLSTQTSDKTVVEITSTEGITEPGEHKITIERLAKNDIALSNIEDGTGNGLAGFGDGSVDITIGDKTETISVETTYLDENEVPVQKTNEEILKSFADAINQTFGDEAQASVFNVNGDNFQLSVKSKETGYDNRIQFQGATGVAAEITGQMTHLTPQADLDARFVVDGVTFERAQNTIDDALEGITFNLKSATGEEETISVARDTNKAKANINSFINTFNDVNKTIRDRTFIDAENDRRGALQDMRSVRNLTYNLRQTGILDFEGAAEGELARLSDIGIGFENDGKMFVEDSDLFTEMIETRSDEIEQLFTAEGSIIGDMKTQAEAYTKSEGILTSLEDGVEQRIGRLDRRIKTEVKYLEKYEEQQRDKFNKLQLILDQGEAQFQQVTNFRSMMGF